MDSRLLYLELWQALSYVNNFLAKMLTRKQAIKIFFLPRHLTCASALPGKTGNTKTAYFHLTAIRCFAQQKADWNYMTWSYHPQKHRLIILFHWHWRQNYSRSISFFSWCLTQSGVGECGHPVRARCQSEHTEASRRKAIDSALLDLTGEFIYIMTKVCISTFSNISSGRSFSFYSNIISTLFTT